MPLSWNTKNKLKYFSIFFLFILLIAGFVSLIIYFKYFEPSCFDKKQNQNETGIDCGGKCSPCAENLKEPLILWTRFLKEKNGEMSYDAAALVENPNPHWASSEINYEFKLFGDNNILISERKGKTFLNPKEKFIIFENSIEAQIEPKIAILNIRKINNWMYETKEKPDFIITKKSFEIESSILEAKIKNNSPEDLAEVFLTAELIDENGNVFAVSSSKIKNLGAYSEKEAIFTWQERFEKEPSQIEILPRVNLSALK